MRLFKGLSMVAAALSFVALGYGAWSCTAEIDMTCTEDDQCFQDVGYGCDTRTGFCRSTCTVAGECLDSETCDVGFCVFESGGGGGGGSGGTGGSGVEYCVQCQTAAECATTNATACPTATDCDCTGGYCIPVTPACDPVCAATHNCVNGTCIIKCDGDNGAATTNPCPFTVAPKCEAVTALCRECLGDIDCTGDKSSCHLTTRTCGCTDDGECAISNGDIGGACYDGTCGCDNNGECGGGTTAGLGESCDQDTGRCMCVLDTECTATGTLGTCQAP